MKVIVTILFFSLALYVQAQEVVKIKTSAICDMCKYTIEKDMAFEKGVKDANLNLENKVLTVKYNPRRTDPKTIRKRITMIGYDADSLKRDEQAHSKLDLCCQSDENRVPILDHDGEH